MAFPRELELKDSRWRSVGKRVKAVRDGQLVTVKPSEVDYLVPTAAEMYSEVTNLVPFLSSNSGGRSILGTAQMVRSGNLEESKAFSLGQRSPADGVVLRVQKTHIKVRARGTGKIHTVPVFENIPLNRGSFLHSTPLVKAGDQVKKGQLLADNNFTQGGTLAIGRNLNTAIMPFFMRDFEGGIVILVAAAKSSLVSICTTC